MKKIALAIVVSFGTMASVWAAAPQHLTEVSDTAHHQAQPEHESMVNCDMSSQPGKNEWHNKMMETQVSHTTEDGNGTKPFSSLNEHERAAIMHKFTHNGESGPHMRASEKHLQMMQKSGDSI
jgi:hypothetical protein